jgi:hypothetical protein
MVRCFAMKTNFMSLPSRSRQRPFRMSRSVFFFDLAPQPLDLVLLRLHLPVAGEGLHGLCAELLHPLAQHS